MKKFSAFLILVILPFCLFSQNSYYSKNKNTYLTAKKLDSIFEKAKDKSKHNPYCIEPSDVYNLLNPYGITSFSDQNPFFSDYAGGFKGLLNTFKRCGEEDRIDPNKPFILSSKSNDSEKTLDWQSAILLGTADFMAERFKDELVNYALRQLIKNLKEEKLESVRILFPKSVNYINNFLAPNQDKGFYYSDLEMLRYYTELDLQDVTLRLPEFIAEVSGKKNNLITFATKVLADHDTYVDPLEIFNELEKANFDYLPSYISTTKTLSIEGEVETDQNEYIEIENQRVKDQLYLLDIFVNALRNDNNSSSIWIDYSMVNPNLIETDLSVLFYYAILWEQTNNLYDKNIPLGKNELIRLTQKASNSFNSIESVYTNIITKETALEQADYHSLVSEVFRTIDSFTPEDTVHLNYILDLIVKLQESIAQDHYQYLLPNIFLIMDELKIDNTLMDRDVLNTIVLMIDFSMVENAEQMKSLLSTYALPIGSSSLKRSGKFNISFNGYVGLTAGYEALDGDFDNTFFNLGLTAPIGIAISHRYLSKERDINSGSIFVGVFDLGSLVNNSFDDSIEIESDLSFKQFIVPSLGYYFNISNSPFSFGLVGSYHLNSRAFKDQTIETEQIDSFRLNMSVLVDIPFFTLKHNN